MRCDRWVGLQVALVHGGLEKICPHSSTGRADYFGSTVNRAARLLCAAKPGQILAEAPVMDGVLKQWLGINPKASFDGATIQTTASLGSLPSSILAGISKTSAAPSRNKSAPNLLHRKSGTAALQKVANDTRVAADAVEVAANSSTQGVLHSVLQGTGTIKRLPSKQGVHFEAAEAVESNPTSAHLGGKQPPRKSMDGAGYADDELETLEASESCCQAWAAGSPLAVSNCHMLRFLAALGPQHARTDCSLAHQGSMRLGLAGTSQGAINTGVTTSAWNGDDKAQASATQASATQAAKMGSSNSQGEVQSIRIIEIAKHGFLQGETSRWSAVHMQMCFCSVLLSIMLSVKIMA